jgi:hypothetical protein
VVVVAVVVLAILAILVLVVLVVVLVVVVAVRVVPRSTIVLSSWWWCRLGLDWVANAIGVSNSTQGPLPRLACSVLRNRHKFMKIIRYTKLTDYKIVMLNLQKSMDCVEQYSLLVVLGTQGWGYAKGNCRVGFSNDYTKDYKTDSHGQ